MNPLARGRGKAVHVVTTLALVGIGAGLAACGGSSSSATSGAAPGAPSQATVIQLPDGRQAVVKTVTAPDGKRQTVTVDAKTHTVIPAKKPVNGSTLPKPVDSKGPIGPAQLTTPVVPKSDPQGAAVAAVLRTYLTSIYNNRGAQACAQLTADAAKAITAKLAQIAPETAGSTCDAAIVLYQGAYGSAIRNPKISDVRVAGDTATAVGPARQSAKLVRDGGHWKIAAYGTQR